MSHVYPPDLYCATQNVTKALYISLESSTLVTVDTLPLQTSASSQGLTRADAPSQGKAPALAGM